MSRKVPSSKATWLHDTNIGRRTGINVKAGKNIRKFKDGTENFDDYWTESEGEDSMAVLPTEDESETPVIPDKALAIKPMSPFSATSSTASTASSFNTNPRTAPKGLVPEKENITGNDSEPRDRSSAGRHVDPGFLLNPAGNEVGTILRADSMKPRIEPGSVSPRFRTKKRLTYSHGSDRESITNDLHQRQESETSNEDQDRLVDVFKQPAPALARSTRKSQVTTEGFAVSHTTPRHKSHENRTRKEQVDKEPVQSSSPDAPREQMSPRRKSSPQKMVSANSSDRALNTGKEIIDKTSENATNEVDQHPKESIHSNSTFSSSISEVSSEIEKSQSGRRKSPQLPPSSVSLHACEIKDNTHIVRNKSYVTSREDSNEEAEQGYNKRINTSKTSSVVQEDDDFEIIDTSVDIVLSSPGKLRKKQSNKIVPKKSPSDQVGSPKHFNSLKRRHTQPSRDEPKKTILKSRKTVDSKRDRYLKTFCADSDEDSDIPFGSYLQKESPQKTPEKEKEKSESGSPPKKIEDKKTAVKKQGQSKNQNRKSTQHKSSMKKSRRKSNSELEENCDDSHEISSNHEHNMKAQNPTPTIKPKASKRLTQREVKEMEESVQPITGTSNKKEETVSKDSDIDSEMHSSDKGSKSKGRSISGASNRQSKDSLIEGNKSKRKSAIKDSSTDKQNLKSQNHEIYEYDQFSEDDETAKVEGITDILNLLKSPPKAHKLSRNSNQNESLKSKPRLYKVASEQHSTTMKTGKNKSKIKLPDTKRQSQNLVDKPSQSKRKAPTPKSVRSGHRSRNSKDLQSDEAEDVDDNTEYSEDITESNSYKVALGRQSSTLKTGKNKSKINKSPPVKLPDTKRQSQNLVDKPSQSKRKAPTPKSVPSSHKHRNSEDLQSDEAEDVDDNTEYSEDITVSNSYKVASGQQSTTLKTGKNKSKINKTPPVKLHDTKRQSQSLVDKPSQSKRKAPTPKSVRSGHRSRNSEDLQSDEAEDVDDNTEYSEDITESNSYKVALGRQSTTLKTGKNKLNINKTPPVKLPDTKRQFQNLVDKPSQRKRKAPTPRSVHSGHRHRNSEDLQSDVAEDVDDNTEYSEDITEYNSYKVASGQHSTTLKTGKNKSKINKTPPVKLHDTKRQSQNLVDKPSQSKRKAPTPKSVRSGHGSRHSKDLQSDDEAEDIADDTDYSESEDITESHDIDVEELENDKSDLETEDPEIDFTPTEQTVDDAEYEALSQGEEGDYEEGCEDRDGETEDEYEDQENVEPGREDSGGQGSDEEEEEDMKASGGEGSNEEEEEEEEQAGQVESEQYEEGHYSDLSGVGDGLDPQDDDSVESEVNDENNNTSPLKAKKTQRASSSKRSSSLKNRHKCEDVDGSYIGSQSVSSARQRKSPRNSSTHAGHTPSPQNDQQEAYSDDDSSPPVAKKKRGRPPKLSLTPNIESPGKRKSPKSVTVAVSGIDRRRKSILKIAGTPRQSLGSTRFAENLPSYIPAGRKSDVLPRYSVASPLHFDEMTCSQTPMPDPHREQRVNKDGKITKPKASETGVRRSNRTRVKPLDWYRNERILYERRKSGLVIRGIVDDDGVKKGYSRKDVLNKLAKKRQRQAKAPKTPRNLKTKKQVICDIDAREQAGVVVLNPETNEEVEIDCIRSRDTLSYKGAKLASYEDTDPFISCKALQQHSFSAGKLLLRPLKSKPRQIVKSGIMVFYVIYGKVAFTLHRSSTIMESGDFFFVPRGNVYSLENLREVEAKLTFFQIKDQP